MAGLGRRFPTDVLKGRLVAAIEGGTHSLRVLGASSRSPRPQRIFRKHLTGGHLTGV